MATKTELGSSGSKRSVATGDHVGITPASHTHHAPTALDKVHVRVPRGPPRVFERAGLAIARSTLAQLVGECGAQLQPLVDALTAELLKHGVLHADETPVAMLKPGHGKTHRAYLWSYCTTRYNSARSVGGRREVPDHQRDAMIVDRA